MKRLFTLTLLALLTIGAGAQTKKTWDFTQGLSDESIGLLDEDVTNWSKDATDENGTVRWKDLTKMSTIKANGVELEEFRGLKFGGKLGNNGNYLIQRTAFRMARKQCTLAFPKLANGQTITIVGRSANNTATQRTIVPAADYLKYVGDEDMLTDGQCKFIGRNVEGSKGTYTFKWQVETEETDSVDVVFNVGPSEGSIDFTLFMIDDGDAPKDNTIKMAYIFDSSYPGYSADADLVRSNVMGLLNDRITDGATFTEFDLAKDDMSLVTRDSLEFYRLVIVSQAIQKDNAYVKTLREAIGYVPMLNLSAHLYETWGLGKAVDTDQQVLTIPAAYQQHALWKPFSESQEPYVDAEGKLNFLADGTITGYSTEAGSLFADDDVLAMAGDAAAIHLHSAKRNAYLLLPYPFTGMPQENFQDLLPNAAILVADTKKEVTPAGTPTITQAFRDLETEVSIKCTTPNNRIYYTLDGSDATLASTLYTEPFTLTKAGTVINAVAIADGYNLSAMRSDTLKIHRLAKAPLISVEAAEGKAVVTLTTQEEGADLYFNLIGSKDAARSQKYEEPFEVTQNVVVAAFAGEVEEKGLLQSEAVTQEVTLPGYQPRTVLLSRFDGSSYTSTELKNGYDYYDTSNVIDEQVLKDQEGNDSIVTVYAPANNLTSFELNGWVLKTYGQPLTSLSATVTHNVGNVGGYNPETVFDDLDSEGDITNKALQFSSPKNGDPCSASIESQEALQGPFDVIGYISGKNATLDIQVTTDTTDVENWTTVGQMTGVSQSYTDGTKDATGRMWKRRVVSYTGTEKVFVKVASAKNLTNIFNITVKASEETPGDGIAETATNGRQGRVVSQEAYSLSGMRTATRQKGMVLVKKTYEDGTSEVRKVIVK